jgi:hypothetical protein
LLLAMTLFAEKTVMRCMEQPVLRSVVKPT